MIKPLFKAENLKKIDWQVFWILLLAVFFRFFLIDLRPPHHDEGVFGFFVDQITANGFYRYDPTNYHGPFHYYVLFLFESLFGKNNFGQRLPDAIIGLITVYWIIKFSRFIDRRTCLIAALAMAVSPGIVYYGNYAFQESFLVFYCILILWGIIGLWHEGTKKYLWSLGLGIIFMILTKETYFINVGCFIIAWFVLKYWEKIYPSEQTSPAIQSWTEKDLIYIVACGVGLIIFFYSGTFHNMSGLHGLIETYQAYFKSGVKGSGHDKPFQYWVILFTRYEYIASLGVISCLKYLKPSNKWIRYISIYGVGVFLAYSIIPYKTPWCIVNLLWPFFFVFGDISNQFLKSKWKLETKIVISILLLITAFITSRLRFFNHSNPKESYVYVQTLEEIKKITDPVLKIAQKNSANYEITGNVLRSDEWPLPWIWGEFTMVGYYGSKSSPSMYDTDFLVVETGRINEVESNLQNKYFTNTASIRNAQDPSKLYLSYEKFKDLYPNRSPEFVPKPPKPKIPGQGIAVLIYPNTHWHGNPSFKKRFDNINLNFTEQNAPSKPPFSLEFVGEINIPRNITTLILASDDGGFIELDGKRIIEDFGSHGEQYKSATITGLYGWRKIKVATYNIWGSSVSRLLWGSKDGNNIVPEEALKFDERLLK
ncbi:MAG: hypothetical protein A3B68_09215 [Candidatus Melainabacteria bacterium RIFCSPHIGHO2_02_FULL_34_12]|nr:MAG: hypothetical protein A3B68_09215 [Candidatus Melainabacteria bacterium RIFCSPHIGHO2_02_FULL_34_12]